jgi:hypothetical protein
MAFSWWHGLSDAEKQTIADRAKEAQDRTGRHTCYWCGASLDPGDYDLTSDARDPREICKGYCRNRRFFDDPV